MVNYFNGQFAGRAHMKYTSQFIACKVLSILSIVSLNHRYIFGHQHVHIFPSKSIDFLVQQVINMVMLNMIVPGFWVTYSQATSSLLVGDMLGWTIYSDLIFPKIAKCIFTTVGPSGSAQKLDALCLLPQNVLNEKIFVIVWMWYTVQLTVSISNLVYWTVICYSKKVRVAILRSHAMMVVSRKQIMHLTNKAHLGNFFVLNQIAKNTNSTTFVELMSELSLHTVNNDVMEKSI